MKKILFFINTLNSGGAEKTLVDLVNGLDPNAFQATVQTFLDEGVYRCALKPHIQYKTAIRTKNKFLRRFQMKLWMKWLPVKSFYKKYIRGDYDIEVAFLEGFPTCVIASGENKNTCKIGWLHTDLLRYPDSQRAYQARFPEQMAYERLDKIVCVSDAVRQSLIEKYAVPIEKTAVLYNVVDDQAIRQKAEEACPEAAAAPLVISVGRLTEQKGFDRLLRTHKRLIDDGVSHTLWIVGEGEKRQELEAYIREHRLESVKLLGFQSNPYQYIAKADLLVSSSYAEGFSTVITEAVVLGVPVISTNTAGAYEPREMPRCNIVVDDEDALFAQMKRCLTDPDYLKQLKQDTGAKRPYFRKTALIEKAEAFFGSK